jgi:predicted dehydrogenase
MVVGLVGCGRWGRHILRDLVSLGCEVPVVARSDESRARATEGGAAALVPDVASLPELDGAVVATTTSTHAAVVEELLERGVPVFCEKPLTDDPEAAASLAAEAPDRLFVMDKWRYHPGVLELAAIAREQRLGTVSGLTTTRIAWGNPHDDVDAVWVLAPHDLSIALEVLGAVPRPESALGQQVDGRLVRMSAFLSGEGWWHAFEVSARSPVRERRVELHCEEGVAVLAGAWDEHVTVFREGVDGPAEATIETPGELPLLAQLRVFVEHLDGGPPPRSSAADGAAIVAALGRLRGLAGVR